MLFTRRSVMLAFLSVAAATFTNAQSAQTPATRTSSDVITAAEFTIQVGAFPSAQLAEPLIQQLAQAGEAVASGLADVPGKGKWVRILVGAFPSAQLARRHAQELVFRGIINEYLIKSADEYRLFARAGKATRAAIVPSQQRTDPVRMIPPRKEVPVRLGMALRDVSRIPINAPEVTRITRISLLPELPGPVSSLASTQGTTGPAILTGYFQGYSPNAGLSLRTLPPSASFETGESGGLYLSGDVNNAMERLVWILGPGNQSVVDLEPDGRVRLDQQALERAAGIRSAGQVGSALGLEQFISSNEGLLLIVQLTQSRHRYGLQVGTTISTMAGPVKVDSSVNLDDRYDSRINGLRRQRMKRDCELPPAGFSAAIGINPSARWVNLETNRLVPEGVIAFHELAEAYAKVDLNVEYISEKTGEPGAHQMALAREVSLRSQRADLDIALTCGTNQVFRSYEEVTRFTALKASLLRSR